MAVPISLAIAQEPVELVCACGRRFACGASTGRCWCMGRPPVMPVPAEGNRCLCPACLDARLAAEQARPDRRSG